MPAGIMIKSPLLTAIRIQFSSLLMIKEKIKSF